MLLSFVQFCNQIEGDEIFYTDQTMPENREPGLILPGELQRLRELMLAGLQNEDQFMKWIGGFLTEPRSFHEPLERPVTEKILRAGLKKNRPVERAEGARFAYYMVGDKLHFAAEGECFVLDRSLTDLVSLLCREQNYAAEELLAHSEKLGFMELLCHLWNQSYIRWADES
jgi:50S ribosomal protein L16 3-hydroxylase